MLAAALAAAVVSAPSAETGQAGSRLVDRTVSCSTAQLGGVRQIEVRAHAGVRESRSEWRQLPFAVVATGNSASLAAALDNSFGWITAGSPSGTTTMDSFVSYPHSDGTIALNRQACRATSARVVFGTRGLTGGAASQLRDDFDCVAPRRVIVRLRARLQSPTLLSSTGRFLRTITPALEAQLAVRTPAGKRLVYASTAASGKARVFTAPACTAD